ncbi:signal peptide peptidase SppA [Candidatus Binatia bacterium]|nr:signal peptide peptidase SppA [Candidatus Binatia bacterium]
MQSLWRRHLSLLLTAVWASGCFFVTGEFDPLSTRPKPLEEHVVSGEGRTKILLIDIADVITGSDQRGPFGITVQQATTARVFEQIERARKDDDVRALLVRINSPGGGVTASDVVFHQLRGFAIERKLPLVAHLLDLATSGGYYVALAADQIVASPTTVTGSIGVVMYGLNFSGLMQKLGVADQTIKTGVEKDVGSPLRPMTPEDRQLLLGLLDPMKLRFVELVRERRPQVSSAALAIVADGRPVGAHDALRDGLIDSIGYLDDTVRALRTRVGDPDARVVMYRRPQEFAENVYSGALPAAPQVNIVNIDVGALAQPPQFMYLWLPPAQ